MRTCIFPALRRLNHLTSCKPLPAKTIAIVGFRLVGTYSCPIRSIRNGGRCAFQSSPGAGAAGLERLKAVVADCQRAGANVAWRTGDLANAGTASELVGAAREAFGS